MLVARGAWMPLAGADERKAGAAKQPDAPSLSESAALSPCDAVGPDPWDDRLVRKCRGENR
jgi:hypothetical protein